MLLAAATLHDIGIFIGHKKHHKHSLYIISQSEVPEFTQREIDIIANVARYHRKGVPAVHHDTFTRLASEDRERVVKLASILRIADALDREHLQAVRAVKASAGKSRLTLELDGRGRPAAGALGPAPQGRPVHRHLRPGGGDRGGRQGRGIGVVRRRRMDGQRFVPMAGLGPGRRHPYESE